MQGTPFPSGRCGRRRGICVAKDARELAQSYGYAEREEGADVLMFIVVRVLEY